MIGNNFSIDRKILYEITCFLFGLIIEYGGALVFSSYPAELDAVITCFGYVFIIGLIQFIRSKEKHWLFAFLSITPLIPAYFINNGYLILFMEEFQIIASILTIVSLLLIYMGNKQFLKKK